VAYAGEGKGRTTDMRNLPLITAPSTARMASSTIPSDAFCPMPTFCAFRIVPGENPAAASFFMLRAAVCVCVCMCVCVCVCVCVATCVSALVRFENRRVERVLV
jgi:hypothetical protein